eukprot:COSAG01_NODE_2225_length_8134_cov_4.268326_8_plen_155_part_00
MRFFGDAASGSGRSSFVKIVSVITGSNLELDWLPGSPPTPMPQDRQAAAAAAAAAHHIHSDVRRLAPAAEPAASASLLEDGLGRLDRDGDGAVTFGEFGAVFAGCVSLALSLSLWLSLSLSAYVPAPSPNLPRFVWIFPAPLFSSVMGHSKTDG